MQHSRNRVRLVKRRRKIRLILFGTLSLVFIVIFLFVVWLSYHPRLNIKSIKITGEDKLRVETIKFFIESWLNDGSMHIFSPKNELLLDRNEIAKALLGEFPRIKTVLIPFTKFKQELVVHVTERVDEFLWCDSKPEERCYFVDQEGYIFATAPADANLQIIRNELTNYISTRHFVTSKELFSNLKFIFMLLEQDMSLLAVSATISNSDALIKLHGDLLIKVALDTDIQSQIDNLETVLDSQDLNDEITNIDYIDLRFGNRVYYKLYK